ncbi:glycine betaine ABC transporter substrate-binding protein [Leucobacter japonicus]|uniref:glycine betaine ABC transporter substrate-binding protein n=1 Tax=Leucobacter japonicus TaxID=1461259 RepID=UPI00138F0FED|nr:glycine betaine ABC transporter substrate-binding protein [Leucobacter japonicus]
MQQALAAEGAVEIFDAQYGEASLYTHVLAKVYERAGGEATVTPLANLTQHLPVVAAADNGISPSLWDFSFPELFAQYVDQEKTVDAWDSDIVAEEGWYVPTYMIKGDEERGIEATCPELPDWEALNECVDLLKSDASGDKGAFLTAGPEWAGYYGDEDRIKNLGLNFEIEFTGSEAALTAAIKRAYDRGEPFVALAWSPHYVTLKYDLTRVEFPPYSDECWGNTYACNWPDIVIKKGASAKLDELYPTADAIFRNADIDADDILEMMIAMEEEGKTYEQAAEEWLTAHPDRWQSWVPEEPVTARAS